MFSTESVIAAVFATATITVLLFMFLSFLVHFGRKTTREAAAIPKEPALVATTFAITLTYIAEAGLLFHGEERSTGLARTLAAIYFAISWMCQNLRVSFLLLEMGGLSFLSVMFGVPLLLIDLTFRANQSSAFSLLAIDLTRLLLVLPLLSDCFFRFPARKESHGDNLGAGQLDTSSTTSPDIVGKEGQREFGRSSDPDDDLMSDNETEKQGFDFRKPGTTKLRQSSSWAPYAHKLKTLIPHIVPKNDLKIQSCFMICLLCMIAKRFLNVLIPQQLGIISNRLIARETPYLEMVAYLVFDVIDSESGLYVIEKLAKTTIENFSYHRITTAAFDHVLSLSMDFHTDSDSAEVMKAIEQGEALTNVLELAVLDIAPTVIDISVAFGLLFRTFGFGGALCMLTASLIFLTVEIVTSSWNLENRRRLTKAERAEASTMHQAVQGWQSVVAFNASSYESLRFSDVVTQHLSAKAIWSRKETMLSALSQGIVPLTFFILMSLVVHQITLGEASPGDFVFISHYWESLIWPLRALSHEYRYLISDLIDAERLLDLLSVQPSIVDKEDAVALQNVKGHIEFQDISFSYTAERPVIHDINLVAAPGETIALVGTTGSGKSSLMKLFMRLYDVTSGSIKIDGQDIRQVTLSSLRNAIGIVPQEPVLFNGTIMDNVRYANMSASDEDVREACRSACIHERVLTFPEGYKTLVGENGVKLSSGEAQRLAIARMFVKDAAILILDEATSAVDVRTEAEIQKSLKRLCGNKTTFVVAHRLSTIVEATRILVLEDGTVVETGSHQDLVARDTRYSRLWAQQSLVHEQATTGE